jgi:SAM-dependent methyltransferase
MSKSKTKTKASLAIAKLLASRDGKVKLDIACGGHKQGPDWIGIDIQAFPGVDIVHDIETYPWPLPDACVDVAVGSHIAEHINPAKFGFINWMNEIWRVMKPEGQLMLALPYAGSHGFYQDPTHVNPCNETTWSYFDPLASNGFWQFYKPKPWKITNISFQVEGFMEVAMEKRRLDVTYAK